MVMRVVRLTLWVLLLFSLVISASVESSIRMQDSKPEAAKIKLSYKDSPALKTENDQPLKRAVVVARKRKTKVGTVFAAYLLLTNLEGERCDAKEPITTGDADFAVVALISEKFDEKKGPEGTAIHRVLFGTFDDSQPRYLYVGSQSNRENLKEILGDVAYHAEPAWPIGWGSHWSVTVIPKGTEKQTPLEVRLEDSKYGWSLLWHHVAAKKQWESVGLNFSSLLVLSRDAAGPNLRLEHRGKAVSVNGNIPLTVCGLIPEDAPMPFAPDNK
jgi:hypothetical protein